MKKLIVLMPVIILCIFLAGCSTTTCSLTHDKAGRVQRVSSSVDKGKLMMEGMNFARFDEPVFKAVQGEWDAISNPGARNKIDCKFKYELKNTHEVMSGLSAVLWFGTLFTFPMVIPREMICSAEFVIRDQNGKIIKTLQSEKIHAEMTTYMSGLPTSWLVHLVSSAPINKAGFVTLEFGDVSAEAGKEMFKSAVINELNSTEGVLTK